MKHSRILVVLAAVLMMAVMLTAAGAETATETDPNRYVEKNTGVTLTLPAGWAREEVENNGIHAVTCYTEYEGMNRKVVFMYACVDDWETTGKKVADSRKAFDDVMNTKSVMSLNFGGAQIEEVQFNGITYFRYQPQDSLWQYFIYRNGYAHMFQFDVDENDPYYHYFEAIMNSVVFPEV